MVEKYDKALMRYLKDAKMFTHFNKAYFKKCHANYEYYSKKYKSNPIYLFRATVPSNSLVKFILDKKMDSFQKSFNDFLDKYNVRKYYYQYRKRESQSILNIYNPELYISNAFSWALTKQGYVFWENLAEQWTNEYLIILNQMLNEIIFEHGTKK